MPDGAGVVFVSGFLDGDALRATRQGVSRVVPSAAEPIFNTQSVAEMRNAELEGAPVVRHLRQALMNPCWASSAVVKASLARICDLLFHMYGRRHVASELRLLLTLPGARPQVPHGGAADKDQLGNPHRMIGDVMAVKDDSVLDTWPGRFCDLTAPGAEQCVVRTFMVERTIVPIGGLLVILGDMVHRADGLGRVWASRVGAERAPAVSKTAITLFSAAADCAVTPVCDLRWLQGQMRLEYECDVQREGGSGCQGASSHDHLEVRTVVAGQARDR